MSRNNVAGSEPVAVFASKLALYYSLHEDPKRARFQALMQGRMHRHGHEYLLDSLDTKRSSMFLSVLQSDHSVVGCG